TRQAAEKCAAEVEATGLKTDQIKLVGPSDERYGKKLEPENDGMAKTLVRSHTSLGVGGFLLGLVLWGALYVFNTGFVRMAPASSLTAFLFFATAGGMMLGGFIAMRPDHQGVIQTVNTAVEDGEWSLVLHPQDEEQAALVTSTLNSAGVKNIRSL